MHRVYFICERKFYARKKYATLEINPYGRRRQLAEIWPHMRSIGIILVPKTAILVVSATDRESWPDQKDHRSGDENGILWRWVGVVS